MTDEKKLNQVKNYINGRLLDIQILQQKIEENPSILKSDPTLKERLQGAETELNMLWDNLF
jgi:hypothetical protein